MATPRPHWFQKLFSSISTPKNNEMKNKPEALPARPQWLHNLLSVREALNYVHPSIMNSDEKILHYKTTFATWLENDGAKFAPAICHFSQRYNMSLTSAQAFSDFNHFLDAVRFDGFDNTNDELMRFVKDADGEYDVVEVEFITHSFFPEPETFHHLEVHPLSNFIINFNKRRAAVIKPLAEEFSHSDSKVLQGLVAFQKAVEKPLLPKLSSTKKLDPKQAKENKLERRKVYPPKLMPPKVKIFTGGKEVVTLYSDTYQAHFSSKQASSRKIKSYKTGKEVINAKKKVKEREGAVDHSDPIFTSRYNHFLHDPVTLTMKVKGTHVDLKINLTVNDIKPHSETLVEAKLFCENFYKQVKKEAQRLLETKDEEKMCFAGKLQATFKLCIQDATNKEGEINHFTYAKMLILNAMKTDSALKRALKNDYTLAPNKWKLNTSAFTRLKNLFHKELAEFKSFENYAQNKAEEGLAYSR